MPTNPSIKQSSQNKSVNAIGVIGLAVMGKNLAKNFASRGISTAVFNRTYSKTEELLSENNSNLFGYKTLQQFVSSLQKPRKIMLMVKSGPAVDTVIAQLTPLLDENDIIIDGGNSKWTDTKLRQNQLENSSHISLAEAVSGQKQAGKKIHFIGCGVSGGEEGALRGPSIMPGGNKEAVQQILPLLKQAAAVDFNGNKCVTWVGNGPAGHFVKMVHNGIEYAIMQLIAEIYDILRLYGFSNVEMKEIFTQLNTNERQGFLLDITTKIFEAKDVDSASDLLDVIVDEAKAKGTGSWTVEAALEHGVCVPAISAAVFARILSARSQSFNIKKQTREVISQYSVEDFYREFSVKTLQNVFSDVMLSAYLQGLDLIQQVQKEHSWEVDLAEVCRIWQGGCIIKSKMLKELPSYFSSKNLNFSENLQDPSKSDSWDLILAVSDLPLPVIHASWDYLIGLTNQTLPTNLIQAQRDYFGAHTYQKTGNPQTFSGGWNL